MHLVKGELERRIHKMMIVIQEPFLKKGRTVFLFLFAAEFPPKTDQHLIQLEIFLTYQ